MRISRTNLNAWLNKNGHSQSIFIKAFMDEFGAKDGKGGLGAGTDQAGVREYVLDIEMDGTPLLDGVKK